MLTAGTGADYCGGVDTNIGTLNEYNSDNKAQRPTIAYTNEKHAKHVDHNESQKVSESRGVTNPEERIRNFIDQHGHLPRSNRKDGSDPFEPGERVLGMIVSRLRVGTTWVQPTWFPVLDKWSDFVSLLSNTPTRQQKKNRDTVLKNVENWCNAAVSIGQAPKSRIPKDVQASNKEQFKAWQLAVRSEQLMGCICGGQFYEELTKPALDIAKSILTPKLPELVCVLQSRLRLSLLLKQNRVDRRRVSRVARNNRAKLRSSNFA